MKSLKPKRVVNVSAFRRRRPDIQHILEQHSLRMFWPYAPIFLVLIAGIICMSIIAGEDHTIGYATNIQVNSLLASTNGARTAHHKPSLQLNTMLSAAAQAKATTMATQNYWSHTAPDGRQPWWFMSQAGYKYTLAGETLAYGFGDSEQVVSAWIASPEHRVNVLNTAYQDVGFATINIPNYIGLGHQTLIVALYGEPVTANDSDSTVRTIAASTAVSVSRLDLISQAKWPRTILITTIFASLGLFFTRHVLAWRKVLLHGDPFLLRHVFFDVFLLALAILAFIVSHIAGTIL